MQGMIAWDDLRYLLAIAQKGSLAQAAKQLGVDHSTLSRRLTALEQALGTKLFTRSSEGLTGSAALSELLPRIEEMQRQVDAIERSIGGFDQRISGHVRVTISEALSGYLVQRLGQLRTQHPELMVDVYAGNQSFDLLRGEADIAVRVREVTEPDLVTRKLTQTVWALYANASYIARHGTLSAPDALHGHDLVGYDASLRATPGGLWLDAHGAGAKVVLRSNSIVSAMNAASVGLGIAAIPCFLGDLEPALQRAAAATIGQRDIWLVVHPDLARVARVRVVMDYLIECFERDSPTWRGERPRIAALMP